jgi:hypothetical protein
MELVDFTITNEVLMYVDVEEFQTDCRACTWGRFGFQSTRVMPSFLPPHSLLARATPRDSAVRHKHLIASQTFPRHVSAANSRVQLDT